MADTKLTVYTSHVHYDIDPQIQDCVSNTSPCLDMFLQKKEKYNGIGKAVPQMSAALTTANYDPTATTAVSLTNTTSTLKSPVFANLGHYVCDYNLVLADKEIGNSPLAVIKTEFEKRNNAKKSLVQIVADDIYDGVGTSNTMRGIDYLIDPTATTDWGGTDANDYAGWDSPASSTATVLNQMSDITSQILSLSVNGSKPDISFTASALYARLLDLIGSANVITNGSGKAKFGFTGMNFMDVDFVRDVNATADYLYILTSGDLGLLHGALFEDTGLARISNLHRSETGLISVDLQPYTKNRRIHGGFTSLTTS